MFVLSDADGGLLGQVLFVDCRWIMETGDAKCLIDGVRKHKICLLFVDCRLDYGRLRLNA